MAGPCAGRGGDQTGATDAGSVRGRAASTQTFTGSPATRARGVLSSLVTTYRHTTMPAATSRRLVALALPPGEPFIDALDAAWRRGDAVMPMSTHRRHRPQRSTGCWSMRLDEPVDDGVALVIMPRRGSTGEPKGVLLTHAALEASARADARANRPRTADDRVAGSCLPWSSTSVGLQVLLRSWRLGIPLVGA